MGKAGKRKSGSGMKNQEMNLNSKAVRTDTTLLKSDLDYLVKRKTISEENGQANDS